jgi:hypothetical protein
MEKVEIIHARFSLFEVPALKIVSAISRWCQIINGHRDYLCRIANHIKLKGFKQLDQRLRSAIGTTGPKIVDQKEKADEGHQPKAHSDSGNVFEPIDIAKLQGDQKERDGPKGRVSDDEVEGI